MTESRPWLVGSECGPISISPIPDAGRSEQWLLFGHAGYCGQTDFDRPFPLLDLPPALQDEARVDAPQGDYPINLTLAPDTCLYSNPGLDT